MQLRQKVSKHITLADRIPALSQIKEQDMKRGKKKKKLSKVWLGTNTESQQLR